MSDDSDGVDWSDEPDDSDDAESFDTGIDIPEVDDDVTANGHTEADDSDEGDSQDISEQAKDHAVAAAGEARTAAERTADVCGSFLASLPRFIPKQSRLFRRMALVSLKNYYKRSPGDAIGIESRPGQKIDFVPVKYKPSEDTEEKERGGWHLKGTDRSYDAGPDGQSVSFIDGKVPSVLLHSDASTETGWLAPRIGQAIELDNYSPVFVGPRLQPQPQQQQAEQMAQNGAVADGGQSVPVQTPSVGGYDMIDPGEFNGETVVDLSPEADHDGMRISLSKAKEWFAESADSEKMQMQEERGYLAGLANSDETDAKRIFLYAVIFCIVVIAIVVLGPEAVGGGGGGGGGINPLMATGLTGL